MKPAKVVAAILASALLISPSFAAEVAPLPAGKPSGTREAALQMGGIWLVASLAVAAALIGTLASTTQGSSSTGTSA